MAINSDKTAPNSASDNSTHAGEIKKNYSLDLGDYLDNVKPSRFTKFLWWCCGADSKILVKATNYDRVKYAGIGGIVFVCGALATLSGGLAFQAAFGSKSYGADKIEINNAITESSSFISEYLPFLADISLFNVANILFALIWGLMIFNIDRFIVSSTGKGDGTDNITLKEFGQATPRLIIALIIAITMSKPLEIKVFESEINAELEKEQREYVAELNESTEAKFNEEYKKLEEKRKPLDLRKTEIGKTLEERRLEIVELRDELQFEIQGRTRSGVSGFGPAARQIEANIATAETELEFLRASLTEEQATIDKELFDVKTQFNSFDSRRAKERLDNEKMAKGLDGLLKRIEIGDEVAGIIAYFLMLLLICIEVGPIFFKLMMNKGPYDYMEQNLKYKIQAYNGIVIEGEFYADGKEGKWVDKLRYIEVESESKLTKKRNQDQLEVNEKITELSKKKAIDDVSKNPEKYI
ncbi:MAG: DUF4407 domain-containing protein [Flavobacteriaceae bacterium]|mgnify:CR=1 FL=1|jgi:hypothetical protein|nr:DUF4407 domain-containing protein [Flavobacteriaceae bacterium]